MNVCSGIHRWCCTAAVSCVDVAFVRQYMHFYTEYNMFQLFHNYLFKLSKLGNVLCSIRISQMILLFSAPH